MTFAHELKFQQDRWNRLRFNIWPLNHCVKFGRPMALIIDCQTDRKPGRIMTPNEFLDVRTVAINMN
jgi:hypothetical protein